MRAQLRLFWLAWPLAASTAVVGITCGDPAGWFPELADRLDRMAQSRAVRGVIETLHRAGDQSNGNRERWAVAGGSAGEALAAPAGSGGDLAYPAAAPRWLAAAERGVGGVRAMKLPERLAATIGGRHKEERAGATLRAPRRQSARELAGLARVESPRRRPGKRGAAISESSAAASSAHPASLPSSVLFGSDATELTLSAARGNLGAALASRQRQDLRSASSRAADAGAGGVFANRGRLAARAAGLDLATADRSAIAVGEAAGPRHPVLAGAVGGGPGGWPRTEALYEQLEALGALAVQVRSGAGANLVSFEPADRRPMQRWARQVGERLGQLQSLRRLASPRAGELVDQLARDAAAGIEAAEQLEDRDQQLQWLRAAHALSRRTAVWRPVWQVARQANHGGRRASAPTTDQPSDAQWQRLIAQVRSDLRQTGDPAGWADYLLLDAVQQAAAGDPHEDRTLVAQRLLSRLQWYGLDAQQRRWLDRDSINRLAEAVRPWAGSPIDYARLVSQIERQESDAIDLASIEIADTVQSLRFADSDRAARVADAINTHYRNANVRFAIRDTMLQRLLPAVEPRSVPLRDKVFGTQVRGTSQIRSRLQLRLRPSPDRWTLELATAGEVDTRSVGLRGPVALRTRGRSQFTASTPIEITRDGARVETSDVDVQGRNRLSGIRSDYDGWPLLGPLVHKIAKSQYEGLAPRTRRYTESKVRREVRREIDGRAQAELDEATERLRRAVLGPLGELDLDPMVADMETTEERLIARYRLAGDWQLAAFTPRPRAPQSSLMSLQVHQSALNNTLEQLLPRDQPTSIRQLVENGLVLFGRDAADVPEDVPADVKVQFTRTRPITVEIKDGLVWVTMRIVRLSRDDSIELSRFIVRAAYRPHVDGLHASLVREGHLRISGPGMSMRERLPVRAVFNKVLSSDRPLPLTLPALADAPAARGLAVSQLELRDGWIALAVSDKDAPRIAVKPADD